MRVAVSKVRTLNSKWLRFLVASGRGRNPTGTVHDSENHPCILMRRKAAQSDCGKPVLATWAGSFIFAGSSAFLLLFPNLFSDYWYFCLFALTPFLYRVVRAEPRESFRLGLLLGLSFFGALAVDSLVASPVVSTLRLLCGTTLFALFGWSVGWARQCWGFNPSLVAMLWVGLEMGLLKLGFARGLLGEAEFSHPFLHSLVGLFGLLAASAIIVLLNSLLVLAIVETIRAARIKSKAPVEDERKWSFFFTRNLVAEKVYLVPEGRAPPPVCTTACATRPRVNSDTWVQAHLWDQRAP